MKLIVDGKLYKYKYTPLYLGRKKINIEIERENLKLLFEIFSELEIEFVLMYGTLLGAIRDNGFIEHDEDVDIALEIRYFDRFKKSLFKLRDKGFELIRIDDRGFASIMKNGEYIDLYFFTEINDNYSVCCGNYIFSEFLKNKIEYSLYGQNYKIPALFEKFFLVEYGEDWNVPIEFKQSLIKQYIAYFIQVLKLILPNKIKKLVYKRKDEEKYNKFIAKVEKYENFYNHN